MGSKHWILPIDHFKTHLFFFKFLVGGPFSAWILVRRLCQNFKALQRGHLTSVRGPISYRIRFMVRRSFFVFVFSTKGVEWGGVRRLVENSTISFLTLPLASHQHIYNNAYYCIPITSMARFYEGCTNQPYSTFLFHKQSVIEHCFT